MSHVGRSRAQSFASIVAVLAVAGAGCGGGSGAARPASTPAASEAPGPSATPLATATPAPTATPVFDVGAALEVAPAGLANAGFSATAHGGGATVVAAGGPTQATSDVYAIALDGDGVAAPPEPLHVRRDDSASQEAAISQPRVAYDGDVGMAVWHETDCFSAGSFGCQLTALRREMAAAPDAAGLLAAGPAPFGSCRSGFYGAVALAPALAGDGFLAAWRVGSFCIIGGDLRAFGVAATRLDRDGRASPAFSTAEPATEPISDVAVAARSGSSLAVWWQRRYTAAAPQEPTGASGIAVGDAIVGKPLAGGNGAVTEIAEAGSGSPFDAECNLLTSACFHPAQAVAPPALVALDDGFLAAWVAVADAAPVGATVTTDVRAAVLSGDGALVGVVTIAGGETKKEQPLAVASGSNALVAWRELGADDRWSVHAALVGSDGSPLLGPAKLVDDAIDAALVATPGGALLVFGRLQGDAVALLAAPISWSSRVE